MVDKLVDAHLQAEVAGDIAGVLATLTEDVEHEPHPAGSYRGHDEVRSFYENVFGELSIDKAENVRRWYGDNFVVDEARLSLTVRGNPFGIAGNGRKAEVPILHVFEIVDGKISREVGYLDFAALMAQLA